MSGKRCKFATGVARLGSAQIVSVKLRRLETSRPLDFAAKFLKLSRQVAGLVQLNFKVVSALLAS